MYFFGHLKQQVCAWRSTLQIGESGDFFGYGFFVEQFRLTQDLSMPRQGLCLPAALFAMLQGISGCWAVLYHFVIFCDVVFWAWMLEHLTSPNRWNLDFEHRNHGVKAKGDTSILDIYDFLYNAYLQGFKGSRTLTFQVRLLKTDRTWVCLRLRRVSKTECKRPGKERKVSG